MSVPSKQEVNVSQVGGATPTHFFQKFASPDLNQGEKMTTFKELYERGQPAEKEGPVPSPALKPVITQAGLKHYLFMKKGQRQVQAWARQLKQALADGATVEPGPCTVEVRRHKIAARIPKEVIEALRLTPEQVATIEKTLETTEGESLVIREYGESYPFVG